MKSHTRWLTLFLVPLMICMLVSCNPLESASKIQDELNSSQPEEESRMIRSDDPVMPTYVDISLFDEENYSSVYLGKDFAISATYDSTPLTVPMSVASLSKNGWRLTGDMDENSTVMAGDSIDLVLEGKNGKSISAVLFNPTDKSIKLKKCNVVKLRFENDFYEDPESYTEFQVNGVNNKMAITDIIDTLGTPSHFYQADPDNYYLNYYISEDDRRNGITIFINPDEDNITAIEISCYQ